MRLYTPTELRTNLYRILESVQKPNEIVYVHSGKTSDYDAVIISKQTWDEMQSVINNKNEGL